MQIIIIDDWILRRQSLIKVLDVLVVLGIIFNIGAVVITNLLVAHNNPEEPFYELNPAGQEAYDYEPIPESYKSQAKLIWTILLSKFVIYGIMIGSYLYSRITYASKFLTYFMSCSISTLFIAFTLDFFNNFGYLLGVVF